MRRRPRPETTACRAAKTLALAIAPLAEPWAARDLTVYVRALNELPPYARELAGAVTDATSPEWEVGSARRPTRG